MRQAAVLPQQQILWQRKRCPDRGTKRLSRHADE